MRLLYRLWVCVLVLVGCLAIDLIVAGLAVYAFARIW